MNFYNLQTQCERVNIVITLRPDNVLVAICQSLCSPALKQTLLYGLLDSKWTIIHIH